MTRHHAPAEPLRGSEAGRDEHRRLDVALHAAELDVDDLDAARRSLLARLSRHSDDFAATIALQALNAFSAGLRTDDPSNAPTHLRDAGLSSLQRMRHRRSATAA